MFFIHVTRDEILNSVRKPTGLQVRQVLMFPEKPSEKPARSQILKFLREKLKLVLVLVSV